MTDFAAIKISGKDTITLLNNLSTNLITTQKNGIIYSCLLTPNGRFMYDFFLVQGAENYIITNKNFADGLRSYITMFKMGNEISFQKTDFSVVWSEADGDFQDPRHPELGFYSIVDGKNIDVTAYHIHRIKLKIADGFHDLTQKESIILDFGLDQTNAISYTKGCYLGQELIARTHHTGVVRKKLFYFQSNIPLEKGSDISQNYANIGKVLGGIDGHHLALIKFENLNTNAPCTTGGVDFFVK